MKTILFFLASSVCIALAPGTSAGGAEPAEAAIRIDISRPGKPISRRLFGKFTEHLGRNIYQGMWAQLLRNPGFERGALFAGRGEKRERLQPRGTAVFWGPLSNAPAEYSLEEDLAVPGQTCQAVRVEKIEPGKEVGLEQEDLFLPLHRESDYLLSFSSKGEGLTAGFAMAIRRREETLARAVFPAPGARWERRTAALSIQRGSVPPRTALTFTIELLSPGKLSLDLLELFPEDAMEGFDRDVVEWCRRIRLPLLRYPGGNFASGYHFRDGIGPRELRPMRINPAWDMEEYNHVGTDEFMAFSRLVGCEPMICVNAGNGTPEEAAAWVEYTNGPATSAMGELRARNGRPEPYGVRIWEIGNELYGDWQIGHCTAEEYAGRYEKFTKAMASVDPSIVFIANGFDRAWNRILLERLGPSVRSLSVHPLIGGGTPREADPAATFRALLAYPTLFEKEVREDLAWAAGRGLSPRVAVTELQIFTNTPPLPTNASLAEALFLGRFIHTAIRLGDAVEMITHSALVNHGGGLRKERETVYPQPVHLAHELYGTMSGVRPVPVEVRCRRYASRESNIPHADEAPDLDAVALLDGSGRELTVVAINTGTAEEIEAEVSAGGAPLRPLRARRIQGPSFMTRNSPEDPGAASLRSIDPPAGGEGRYRFPPHSITEIVFGL